MGALSPEHWVGIRPAIADDIRKAHRLTAGADEICAFAEVNTLTLRVLLEECRDGAVNRLMILSALARAIDDDPHDPDVRPLLERLDAACVDPECGGFIGACFVEALEWRWVDPATRPRPPRPRLTRYLGPI